MLIHVFSDTGVYKGRISSFISISWKEEYQAKGKLDMYVDDSDENAEILRHGYFLYRADRGVAMEIVRIDRDDSKKQIYVGGYTTLNLLNRRCITDETTVTTAETGIYSIVSDNLRGLSDVQVGTAQGYSEAIEEATYEKTRLFETIQEICELSGLGVKMVYNPDTNKHTFTVYKGVDHSEDSATPYIASHEFGNLRSLKVTEDNDDYRNTLVVSGTLTGGQTVWVRVYEGTEEITGMAQREVLYESGLTQREAVTQAIKDDWSENWYDPWLNETGSTGSYKTIKAAETNTEFCDRLAKAGKSKLKEFKTTKNFDAQIDPSDFGTLYDLGDIITCKSTRYGLTFDARISSFTETEAYGKGSLSVVLGSPDVDDK